jgi:SAM-dependent methyltransferase
LTQVMAGAGAVLGIQILDHINVARRGSGRIAIPLAERGLEVHGIDASPAMVARLRRKAGAERLNVVVGDCAEVVLDRSFALVFGVYNLLLHLLSSEHQARCFVNAERHLGPGGRFVVEAAVLREAGAWPEQSLRAERVETDLVVLEATRFDPSCRRISMQRIEIAAHGVRLDPVQWIYASPAELDLMAAAAGLRLEQRWGSWIAAAPRAEDRKQISVYVRASDPDAGMVRPQSP